MKVRVLLLFLSAVCLLKADDSLRPRPATMVTDTAGILSTETRNELEYLLIGRKDDQKCELYVLIEKFPDLTAEEYQEELRSLGDHWSQNDWAILAHDPAKKAPPLVVTGGSFLDGEGETKWSENLNLIQDLSSQTWSEEFEIEGYIHRISDLLVFSSRRPHAEVRATARKEKQDREAVQNDKQARREKLIRYSSLGLAALAIILFLVWKLLAAARKYRFPETQWSRRLDAPHSGGSSLNHKFPPVQF